MTAQTKTTKAKTTKTDAFEDTIQNAAKASTDAMQDGFGKAMIAAGELGQQVQANTDALVESFTVFGKGVEAINTEVSNYAKTSLENGVANTRALTNAKSIQEMVELQADYTKSAMDAWVAGLTTLTGMGTALIKDTAKPINDRAQATAELVQGQF